MALTEIAKPTDKQYKLTDGSGHLLVHPNGSRYWRLQYRFGGKQKMLALGVYPDVSFADARARRDEARKLLANGIDPGDKKKNDKVEQEENAAGLIRSMSRKGCSLDNAVCEGFFGRLKTEMYYGLEWAGVTLENFMQHVDTYIRWYNELCIKLSPGAVSPKMYRRQLGITQ
jgi:transposase InsO family protein